MQLETVQKISQHFLVAYLFPIHSVPIGRSSVSIQEEISRNHGPVDRSPPLVVRTGWIPVLNWRQILKLTTHGPDAGN